MNQLAINGLLGTEPNSFENFNTFVFGILKVKQLFDTVFGLEIMSRINLFVDNATKDSGYTPVILPLFNSVILIKLGILPNSTEAEVAFQFSHELTHYVFFSLLGMDKPMANADEEAICSAASLIVIKTLYPKEFPLYKNSITTSPEIAYQKGVVLASELNYDMEKLKTSIMNFSYN